MKFRSRRPQYEYLRKKWVSKHNNLHQDLVNKHLRQVALGSLGGLMLLSTPSLSLPAGSAHMGAPASQTASVTAAYSKNTQLAQDLKSVMPKDVRNLNPPEEQQVTQLINQDLGISVDAEINGMRLNRTYGLIGGEQHLYRYPGDTLQAHAQTASDWAMYLPSGIAPGLGAWGYFAPSKAAFTPEDALRERYYIAVQTFLAPGYAENVAKYRDFFKYRKMLVVNPKTGQAVVADIADSGPAQFTGKQLGGSPEVMEAVGLAGGPRKGGVLYFFLDDKSDTIPLGPLQVSQPVN